MSKTQVTSTGSARGSRGSRGKERRRRIFTALHDCIIRSGYGRTTLADVAQSAGMTPSHLLYYFRGKEDILEQYFAMVAARFLGHIEAFRREAPEQQIRSLADLWFRGETSNRREIGFMLECFGVAVHNDVLQATKADFDQRCKRHLRHTFSAAPSEAAARDAAEITFSLMIGLRSAVYFDDDIGLADAHRLFQDTALRLCQR